MANASIALSKETSQHLVDLAKLSNQSAQELAERLIKEAIELEEEDILLSAVANEYDVDGAEEIEDSEDVWE
ncbi:hypothetical protein [Wolbachia endosymbiont (group A) of Pogonocherus hispidulus]|uniref:hypothetical protein n=1 Tax=Wolbachia endosymbiont (group A) of Pogonocherus hispidulus TaxID=3066136 RepID=UPI0033413F5F